MKATVTRIEKGIVYAKSENEVYYTGPYDEGFEDNRDFAEKNRKELPLHPDCVKMQRSTKSITNIMKGIYELEDMLNVNTVKRFEPGQTLSVYEDSGYFRITPKSDLPNSKD